MRSQDSPLRGRGHGRAGRGPAAVLFALLFALGACDGESYFGTGPGFATGRDTIPPTIEILQPRADSTISVGDSLLVEVQLEDNRGVAAVELTGVARRGDPMLGRETTVERFEPKSVTFSPPTKDTVLVRYLIPKPDTVSEYVSITVTARDTTDNSATASVQIRLVRGPRVGMTTPTAGQVVTAGRRVPIRVVAIDPAGVSKIRIEYGGVLQDSVVLALSPDTLITADTAVVLPPGATGTLEIRLAAWNVLGIGTRTAQPLRFPVSLPEADQMGPSVSVELSAPPRMELADRVRVRVTARDNDGGSGIARLGVTALAINVRSAFVADTVPLGPRLDTTYAIPQQGVVVKEFSFGPFNVDPLLLPDTLRFQVHAFAVDSAGNCAAAVATTAQSLPCGSFRNEIVAANFIGQEASTLVVPGRTIKLPDGGAIADAIVDYPRQRLYLSNLSANRVDVLDLATLSFLPSGIRVGSQPWGLTIDRTGDTLFVANSGGTNISFVDLVTGQEVPQRRLKTPNTVLYQLEEIQDVNGNTALKLTFIDFSDRPQFIAQDALGRLLYSTVPTGARPSGTIRWVDPDPDPSVAGEEREVYMLIPDAAYEAKPRTWVIANVDSMWVNADGATFTIWDHEPGHPGRTIRIGPVEPDDMLAVLDSLRTIEGRRVDVLWYADHTWNVDAIGLSDTTFVAASGDRRWVAFGEGATGPTGRIMLWNAALSRLSSVVNISDLVGNASERVLGVALNENGSLGVARGQQAAYFFTNDLRHQGRFERDLVGGAGGVTLHPGHATINGSDETTLAFAGTGRKSIKIIDTFHFYERGEILIRDDVIGPLRASLPLPSDNAGLSCPMDDRCVIAKLYGVTSTGGVVVVNVRRRDLRP